MENLAGLLVFARVVEEQSFSEAARKLGMSPSMVSKQIARLEKSLGARLLNRTTRKLSVTEVGENVYQHCARIAREAEEIDLAVAQLHTSPRGKLKLSAPATFGMLHIAPLVSGFLQRYPEVSIELTLNDRVNVDLANDGIDAALTITTGPSDNVVSRKLAPIRWVLCASPTYLKAHGEPKSIKELADHNCLIYPELLQAGAWRFKSDSEDITVEPNGNFRANSSLALRAAALSGLGLAVMPTFVVGSDIKTDQLRMVLPQYRPFLDSALQALYLPGRPLPAKLTTFLDYCRDAFGAKPYWDEGF